MLKKIGILNNFDKSRLDFCLKATLCENYEVFYYEDMEEKEEYFERDIIIIYDDEKIVLTDEKQAMINEIKVEY